MSSYPSSSYYTAQVYETLPESLQEQDAASGYKLWYFIQALVGSLDSLASLYFDSVGGGSLVFPVDPAPVNYSPAMLKSNIASTDTAFTIFNTDPTWDQINTSAPFPLEIEGERILVPGGTSYDEMVSDLAPTAWWKLSDLAGSTTALDSSSQSARGTYSNLLTANQASIEDGSSTGWFASTLPSSASWYRIAYGNGIFVALDGSSSKIAYSADGITWTAGNLPGNIQSQTISFGNGKFVIVGNSSISYSSADGITWTAGTLPGSITNWRGTFGGGKFVAVAYGASTGAYSTDGVTWTTTTLPVSGNWRNITAGGGAFVTASVGTTVGLHSLDGITWTQTAMPNNGNWQGMAYGNGVFVMTSYGPSNDAAYSTDGITWMYTTLSASQSWNSVAFGNGMFVAVASSSSVATYSLDGINWFTSTMPGVHTWQGIASDGVKFVAVAADPTTVAAYTTDLTAWVAGANTTLGASTAWAQDGSYSLTMTATAAGNVQASTPTGTSGVAVTPGETVRAMASFHSPATSRAALAKLDYYDSSGVLVPPASLTIGGTTYGVAVTPNGLYAYVVDYTDATVSVVSIATNTIVKVITGFYHPYGIAITPDGLHAYVACNGSAQVMVVSTASNTITQTITVGSGPYGVTVSPDGLHVYCVNNSGGTVSVISTASNTVVATVTVGSSPRVAVVTPDSSQIYVINYGASTVSVIAAASNTVTATISVVNALTLAMSTDGLSVYAPSTTTSTMSVISTTSNTVTSTPTILGTAGAAIMSPNGQFLYLSEGSNTLQIFCVQTQTVIATITTGQNPRFMAVSPDGTKIFVPSYTGANLVTVPVTWSPVVSSTLTGAGGQAFLSMTVPANATHATLNIIGSGLAAGEVLNADEMLIAPAQSLALPYDNIIESLAPVAWWKLNDAVGSTTAVDSSGNGYTGTVVGGVTFGEPGAISGTPSDTAALFDGTSGYITSSYKPSGLTAFSVAAWFKTTAAANVTFFDNGFVSGSQGFSLLVDASGTVEVGITSSSSSTSIRTTSLFNDNKWHLCVATWDGTNVRLYLEGIFQLSAAIGGTLSPAFASVIGVYQAAGSVGEYFPGDVSEVQIFPTALTAAQIAALYAAAPVSDAVTTWEPGAITQIPSHNGTVYGGVTFGQPGAIIGTPSDTAALFDGSTGYFEAATLTGDIPSSFSVSLWCKPTANNGSNSRIFSWGGGGPQGVEIVLTTADYLSIDIEGASGNITLNGATLTLGEWVFVTIAYDGATLFVYINGILDVSGAAVIGTMRPANPPFVGRYNGGGDYFEGDIAQVAIFPTALTAAQVLNLYNSAPNPNSYDWTATEIALNSVKRGWDNTQAVAHLASAGATGEFDIEHYFAAPGWSQILDINRCPAYALPWLGQFVGVDLSKTPDLTYEQSVQKILSRPGFSRGTVQSIKNALAAIINGSSPISSPPINVSQILFLENTSPIGFNTASLFSAITGTGAITLQLIGVGAAWFNAAANSSLIVQVDSESILIPQGVYSFANGPVSISIPLGNRGYGGTTAANHSAGVPVTVKVSPSMYQYNQYGITLLVPAAYFNIYTYNSLEAAAGGSGTTYATMDTFIAGLGLTNEYNNLNSSPVPSTSNSFANYVYSQRPSGLEIFVGAY